MNDITSNYHHGNPRSVQAHKRTTRNKLRDQLRITKLLEGYPRGLICEEAEILLNMRHQTCSARFSEMKRDGWLVLTGEQRKTSTGSPADVHALPRFMPQQQHEEEEVWMEIR
jgi:hypothetical protein